MPEKIRGTYTLQQVLDFTRQSRFTNRFDYRDRDVLKRITIKKVHEMEADRPGAPTVRYEVISYSYPQYPPYDKIKDRRSRRQRKIRHEYDIILSMDRLSVDTIHWKGRLGSGKKWRKPAQRYIRQIYQSTRRTWERRYGVEETRRRIREHKRRAKYLDVGDWNAREQGINGDFLFRCAYAWREHGHLYGNVYGAQIPSKETNPKKIMFMPKHFINLIEVLLRRGILQREV